MQKPINTEFAPFHIESLQEVRDTGIIYWPTAQKWSQHALDNIRYIVAYATKTQKTVGALFEISSYSILNGEQYFQVKELPMPGPIAQDLIKIRRKHGMLEDFINIGG